MKVEFLNNVTEFFPQYFNETFDAVWLKNNGFVTNADQSPKVTPIAISIWNISLEHQLIFYFHIY